MTNKDYFLYCMKKICWTLFYNSPANVPNVPLFVQQALKEGLLAYPTPGMSSSIYFDVCCMPAYYQNFSWKLRKDWQLMQGIVLTLMITGKHMDR